MKKIIATVLAMVMALALCTTAFAATTDVDAKGYSLMTKDNNAVTMTADKFTKETKGNDTIAGVTYYYADKYEIDKTPYYECDASIATHKLVKGSTVVYLTTVDVNGTAGISKVVDKTVAAVDDAACGQYAKDATAGKETVYVIGADSFWADRAGTSYAMLNGKAVAYDATNGKATAEPHDFTKQNVTTDTKGNVVAVTCDNCKKTFKVVSSVPANYLGSVEQGKAGTKLAGMFILTGETYAAGTTTGTTTSPKTFDAGIAMYVGMALTSVAGSAVVIGKKKEF